MFTTKPIVTIAIASYNNAPFIERCIKSCLSQTYVNLEIIIVDDGSSDNTLDVLDSFRNNNKVRIVQKENGGLSSVRQRGLDEAQGDYICFVDADDYLTPHYIQSMINQIILDRSDICICSTQFENEDGSINDRDSQYFYINKREPLKLTSRMLAQKHSNYSGLLSLSDSWNKMYSIAFLRRICVRFVLPKGYNGSDLAFNHKVALFEPQYSFVSTIGYCHVLYKNSAVRRKRKELQLGFQIIVKDIIEEAQRADCFGLLQNKIINLHYYLLRYSLQDRNNETEGFLNKLKEIKEARKNNKSFIKDYGFLNKGFRGIETMSLQLFYSLFIAFPYLLPSYFSYREKIV